MWVKLIIIIHIRICTIQRGIMVVSIKLEWVEYNFSELLNWSTTSFNTIYIRHKYIIIFNMIVRQYLFLCIIDSTNWNYFPLYIHTHLVVNLSISYDNYRGICSILLAWHVVSRVIYIYTYIYILSAKGHFCRFKYGARESESSALVYIVEKYKNISMKWALRDKFCSSLWHIVKHVTYV